MKKKILAMSLALVMVVGFGKGIVASAETYTEGGSGTQGWTNGSTGVTNEGTTITNGVTSKKEVSINFTSSVATVYSVDINWGSMQGTYSGSSEWQPSTHSFAGAANPWSWTSGANVVTVTNHSNAQVKCGYIFNKSAGDSAFNTTYTENTVEGSMSPNTDTTLPTAVGLSTTDNSLVSTGTLTLTGDLNEDISGTVTQTVGTVTVTLTPGV